MDWFERLTGFREDSYDATRGMLKVEGERLHSLVNGKSYAIGRFEMASLQSLRERASALKAMSGRLKVSVVTGDVRQMHREPQYANALFQVASQFNALEMIGPDVTPEQGVTRYQYDPTQGPACAIAAGAATMYRNYFVPVGDALGQTAKRQLDGLVELGEALGAAVCMPVDALWQMRNGYALCSESGLAAIAAHLSTLGPDDRDRLRGKLRIGVQSDVEATEAAGEVQHLVSQAFCSALPVAYSQVPRRHWRDFASLVLEAAYEATLWSAVLNADRGASNQALLTFLGGGAFGNDEAWILAAMRRALDRVASFEIDAKIVSFRPPSREVLEYFAQRR